MSRDQILILGLLAALLAAFALDRWRPDVIALTTLAAAIALGLVTPTGAFGGFADPAVVTVVEILIITQAIARSHLVESLAARTLSLARGERSLVALLCAAGAGLSVFMNNVGALAIMMPVALTASRRAGLRSRRVLMPLSFATLLGGLCSLVGTPANLIVSGARRGAEGEGFGFFDFAYVGVPLAVAGLIWLTLARRTRDRAAEAEAPAARYRRPIVVEARVPEGSRLVGKSITELEHSLGVEAHGLVRGGRRVFAPRRGRTLEADDLLVLEGPLATLEELVRRNDVVTPLAGDGGSTRVEAVVTPQSPLIGSAAGVIAAFEARDVEVVAITPQRRRIESRLGDVTLSVGDVIVLAGAEDDIREALEETECLPLAGSPPAEGPRPRYAPAIWLALGVIATAGELLRPEIAFGLVVLALALTRVVDLRRAMSEIDWTVVLMLAAMLPVGAAFQTTGAADLVARSTVGVVAGAPAWATVAVLLGLAVAITPFMSNAATAVVLAPIAVGVAEQTGISVDALLMAVAIGASTDFLTPFGHHNNTLVMSAGGYRFLDYPKLGAPLTAIVLALGTLLLTLVWAT